ncbi:hypothetical protein DFH08DRAFT_873595 [Mycena albidolilacea]|uniref:Ubiquitin-like domain-containing protein n=1 Tax=Mycena albidolilacea TaxID=1033008 RepID=A0AAD6ZX88_9AGAR|nr:hypothetical protein DFH08DRAFT_873595 [Mycena albidolilacea]
MVQILVENQWRDSYVFDVQLYDTIRTVKLVIEDLTGMPLDHQRIQHLGHETTAECNFEYDMPELQDDQTLESYGIVDGNVLYLSDKEAVILFVKMLTGKTLEISILLKAPVLSLKEKIQTKEGIPPVHQRFIFDGKQLADHLPLSSYNIQNKSVLHFVPSLRGGGAFNVAYTAVLYPWDGDMRHPSVKGLKLTVQTIVVITGKVHENWYKGHYLGSSSQSDALLPANYVDILKSVAGKHETTEVLHNDKGRNEIEVQVRNAPPVPPPNPRADQIPPLPAFPFPEANPMSHTFKFADRGRSWVKVAIEYPHEAPPHGVTPVTVEVVCWPIPSFRYIKAITITISFEDNHVIDVNPRELWKGPPTQVTVKKNVKLSTSQTLTGSLSAAWNFLTCSLSSSITRTLEEGQETTAPAPVDVSEEVKGTTINGTAASWAITAAETPNGKGLDGTVTPSAGLSFNLTKKPARVTYECVVVHQSPGSGPVVSPTMRSRSLLFWRN